MNKQQLRRVLLGVALTATAAVSAPTVIAATDAEAIAIQRATPLDRSGKRKTGIASYYHSMFNGRKMADGKRFDPNGVNAASRTLPLGTYARVTNLENNLSAVVLIQDRGPYVEDRIVDVSPRVAEEIGITHQGLARVEVVPIVVPQTDGSLRVGAEAHIDDVGLVMR